MELGLLGGADRPPQSAAQASDFILSIADCATLEVTAIASPKWTSSATPTVP